MKGKGFFNNFKSKFKIVILHPETYEEKGGFNMSKMRLTIFMVISVILIILGTAALIVFTPIRELIPGYTDVTLNRRVYEMECRADSIENVLVQKDQYIKNIRRIIFDDEFPDDSLAAVALINKGVKKVPTVDDFKSEQDSLFRLQFEAESQYNLFGSAFVSSNGRNNIPTFFTPLEGLITNRFNPNSKHFGIDMVSKSDAVIKAVADGTVVFSDWSVEKGYVIGIQHAGNIISIYKHNSSLLHNEGDVIHAGDAIAIIGGSGSMSTGPHLHFELWCNGKALNPEDYISFE